MRANANRIFENRTVLTRGILHHLISPRATTSTSTASPNSSPTAQQQQQQFNSTVEAIQNIRTVLSRPGPNNPTGLSSVQIETVINSLLERGIPQFLETFGTTNFEELASNSNIPPNRWPELIRGRSQQGTWEYLTRPRSLNISNKTATALGAVSFSLLHAYTRETLTNKETFRHIFPQIPFTPWNVGHLAFGTDLGSAGYQLKDVNNLTNLTGNKQIDNLTRAGLVLAHDTSRSFVEIGSLGVADKLASKGLSNLLQRSSSTYLKNVGQHFTQRTILTSGMTSRGVVSKIPVVSTAFAGYSGWEAAGYHLTNNPQGSITGASDFSIGAGALESVGGGAMMGAAAGPIGAGFGAAAGAGGYAIRSLNLLDQVRQSGADAILAVTHKSAEP